MKTGSRTPLALSIDTIRMLRSFRRSRFAGSEESLTLATWRDASHQAEADLEIGFHHGDSRLLHGGEFFLRHHPQGFRHAPAISRIRFGEVFNLQLSDMLGDALHVAGNVADERLLFR